tara:strand:- start:77 stop:673 length:597 start_codon:yes stop_codon:yes gene_type:complete
MPISDTHKIIFIHIPKNGGTSIAQYLEMENVGHYHFSHYTQYPEKWKNYKKIAISRNPWDRFVSCYEYGRMEKSFYHSTEGESIYGRHPDYDLLKTLSFDECVRTAKSSPHLLKHQGWRTQLSWISDEKGDIKVDHIFKLENIDDEKTGLLNIIGNKNQIPKVNPSTRKNYKEYYNEETKNIIREIYKEDITKLGYEF